MITGRVLLLVGGYTFHKATNASIVHNRWRCSSHNKKCNAFVVLTDDETKIVRAKLTHSGHNRPRLKHLVTRAMVKPKAKDRKTREEKLAQKRLYRRQKYEEIKKDPEKYAAQKEKDRLRYLTRKEQNKIKMIKDLTPRQQRQKRKQWNENSQRYIEKKKNRAIEQMFIDNSPPTSDYEEIDPQVPQVNELRCSGATRHFKFDISQ
ncbi:hypothetical protein B5X24_HaOG207892 [Helicoverpa armigera]|uniref:FLYWCH-type domain-containing protein n=1 Tax=Helicoverpa armigera TaxID=29058 RepID=A0A2W1BL69_HELAM|nr:hypothetical protein B5X24_HaOG207892 [Helicoverpa armigera]